MPISHPCLGKLSRSRRKYYRPYFPGKLLTKIWKVDYGTFWRMIKEYMHVVWDCLLLQRLFDYHVEFNEEFS